MKDIMYLYILADKVADKTGPIIEATTPGVACRALKSYQAVREHPEEFAIYQMGWINNYGQINPEITLEFKSWPVEDFLRTYDFAAALEKINAETPTRRM